VTGGLVDVSRAAFDVDGVTVDVVTPFLRILRDEHGYDFTPDDIEDFELSGALGVPGEVIQAAVDRIIDQPLESGVRPYPGAARVLTRLADETGLLFVTARRDSEATRKWLLELLPGIDPARVAVAATGDPMKKLEPLRRNGRTVFFDDHPETCRQLYKAGVAAYIFDQPWNRKERTLPRVNGWDAVADLFGRARLSGLPGGPS
jgi:uncharacterized HAD superfamily protein